MAVNGSTVPLTGSGSLQYLDGASFNVSYAVNLANGFQFSEQVTDPTPLGTIAGVVGSAIDYFYAPGASPGSSLSVVETYNVIGHSPSSTFYGGFNDFAPLLFLVQNSQELSYEQYYNAYSCPGGGTSTFFSSLYGSCRVTTALPPDGYLLLDYGAGTTLESGVTSPASEAGQDFISSIQVVDALGNPEPGVQIYSASGTNYNAAQTTVTPETPPIFLVTTGALLGLAFTGRKWKQSCPPGGQGTENCRPLP